MDGAETRGGATEAIPPKDGHAGASSPGDHGHRRERDAERARGAILDAAEDVFARDGFDGARVDVIAELAGYNKSLIFQYFGDKLGLYQAVVAGMKRRVERELGGIVGSYVGGEVSPHCVRQFIEQAARWSFEHYRTRPRDRAILVWETAEGWRTFNCIGAEPSREQGADQPTRSGDLADSGQRVVPGMMRWHLAASAYLRRAQAAGVVRADLDADVLLANAMGMSLFYLASLPRFRMMFPDNDLSAPAALDRAREQLVGLMLHGMMTPEALSASQAGDPSNLSSFSSSEEETRDANRL